LQDAGQELRPGLSTRGAEAGKMFGPVTSVQVLWATIGVMAGDGAKEVEIDAVHGFRPVLRFLLEIAMKRVGIRIRKILQT
jgi:hypothetical protein